MALSRGLRSFACHLWAVVDGPQQDDVCVEAVGPGVVEKTFNPSTHEAKEISVSWRPDSEMLF